MYDFVAKNTQFQSPATLPTEIIYPAEYFPVIDPEWQGMMDEFVGILENFLGSKRIPLSVVGAWESSKPEFVEEPDVRKYLAKSGFWPYCYEFSLIQGLSGAGKRDIGAQAIRSTRRQV